MNKLNTYTSTGSKLFNHLDRLNALQKGVVIPIVMHIMPTSVCNLNCSYCSVKNRPKEELKLKDIKSTVMSAKNNGLKSVIISGGGEPTLYPRYDEMIEFLQEEKLEMGLITNGTTLKNKDINPYKWVRVSINPETIDNLKLPVFPKTTTLGFSYIISGLNMKQISDVIVKLDKLIELYQPAYVRLLADCTMDLIDIQMTNRMIAVGIRDAYFKDIYMQQIKLPKPPKNCYLGYLHPVLYCDGYIYPCDSCVLNNVDDQKFHDKYRLCHYSKFKEFIHGGIKSLVNPSVDCPRCVFSKQNNLLDSIINPPEVHKNFI